MVFITRNKLMLMNAAVVMVTTVLNIVFGMIEVSLLISNYGSTINGLMQTGNQLLGYVSLIEAGIGAAYIYKMYKPIAEDDNCKLSSLYKGFKISMNKAVIKMLLAAAAVSLIYPLFLRKDGLSYLFMITVFLLLSLKTILPYLVTMVPKYMIIVKEQRYKAELISGLCKTATYIIEIILLLFTKLPLQALLIVCILIALLTGLLFNRAMKKIYKSTLSLDIDADLSPNSMSKDVLVHNISRIVFNSTNNIIISVLGSLNAVTIYSNYNLITSQVALVSQSIIDGAAASLGIKIASKDKNSYSVFRELMSAFSCFAGVITSVFVVMINDFVVLWVGKEYCVDLTNRILFGYIMYCSIVFSCLQVARNAKGLYKESKNFTVFQAIINLIFTIILVPFLGIKGALISTVITRFAITIPFNYNLINKKVFPTEKSNWGELISGVIVTFLSICINLIVRHLISSYVVIDNDITEFIFNALIITISTAVVIVSYYLISNKGFKRFLKRILNLLSRKKIKI